MWFLCIWYQERLPMKFHVVMFVENHLSQYTFEGDHVKHCFRDFLTEVPFMKEWIESSSDRMTYGVKFSELWASKGSDHLHMEAWEFHNFLDDHSGQYPSGTISFFLQV